MKKDSLIHLVGFITRVGFDEFVTHWDHYSRQVTPSYHAVLLREEIQTRSRYHFISQHEVKNEQTRFMFMKGRNAEYFADQKVKVVHMGGYQLVTEGRPPANGVNTARLLIFRGAENMAIDFRRQFPYCSCINTYRAYYESCTYDCILELFIPAKHIQDAAQQLQTLPGIELSVYRESLIPQA